MTNLLEEKLRAIQNQRDTLKWKVKMETDKETIKEMVKMISELNNEEIELLNQLEVEL